MTNQSLTDALAQESDITPEGEKSVLCQGTRMTYEVGPTSVLLVAHQGSEVPLLLAPESDYTRQADKIGVSEESKIGTDEFDQKYVIRDTLNQAQRLLTEPVCELVEALEPFVELEFCDDMLRLLKNPSDHAGVVTDLKRLARLADHLREQFK